MTARRVRGRRRVLAADARRTTTDDDRGMYRRAVRVGAVVVLVSGARRRRLRRRPGQDHDRGPADEDGGGRGALRDRGAGARFSIFTIGSLDGSEEKFSIKVPEPAVVPGHRRTRRPRSRASTTCATQYQRGVRPGPGRGVLLPRRLHADHPADLLDVPADDRARRGRRRRRRAGSCGPPGAGGCPTRPGAGSWLAIALPFMPLLANSFGWIFTEMGRQPWAVFGLMTTEQRGLPGRRASARC